MKDSKAKKVQSLMQDIAKTKAEMDDAVISISKKVGAACVALHDNGITNRREIGEDLDKMLDGLTPAQKERVLKEAVMTLLINLD